MNLYNLFEAPKMKPAAGTTGVMDNQAQTSISPVGSGTSEWESKKKPVTMMGVGNKNVVGEARDVQLDELSNAVLGNYKKAAGADASAADKAGDFKRGDKRFKGIVRATKKELANDVKQHKTVDEGQLEFNTPDPGVVVQDLKGNILDKINLSVAAQKYKLGAAQNIKNQLAHQNYTTIGNYVIVSPMSGQPQDATTQGVAEGRKPFRDLKSWTDHAKSQGLKVSEPSNHIDWTHDATDKQGKVRGRFVRTRVPQNSRGFIHKQGVAEGKKKSDTYHIVNKDGKPANLASYADKESAVKDRDAKHQGAEVRQVGSRGKVKSVSEAHDAAAKEIHGNLFHDSIPPGAEKHHVSAVLKAHGLQDTDAKDVINRVRKMGYTGSRLDKSEVAEDDHTDEENGMAQDNLNKMSKASQQINNKVKKLGGNKSLEPWQQQLVATAADKVDAVHHSMDDEVEEGIDGRGERHEPELNPGDSIMLTTVKGRTYTGTLSHINDDSIVFKTLGQGGNPHAPDDMESRSHVVAIKMSHVANIEPLSMTENEQDWGEYEDGDEEQQDEGFFVAIGSEDDGAFVGMITKDGGKWRETEITGNAPYGWGGSYMSYLSSEDVMQHLRNDYGRHAQVKGPFSTEEAAMQYAQSHFDLGSDSEFGDEDYDTLEEQKLQIGDPIVVTYASEYEGEHGEIIDFSPSGSFVIVRMQNGDEASMHLSDVEYSEYEDEEDDEDGIQYWPPKRRPHRDDLDETVNDPDFERMMGKMTSPDSLKTREAVAMMMDLVYHNGASYKEALQQASSSFEIDPAKLQALYQQQLKQQGNPVDEAKGLRKRVRVVKGPAAGKTGWIREVKHGLYKGAPKRFYVDLDDGGHADNLPADALRLVKDLGEAGNPAQQAAIAIAMKKAGKKPKSESMQSAAHKPTGPSFADGKWKGTDSAAQAKNKYVGSGATESVQHDKQVLEYTINNMKRDGYEFFNEDDNGFDKCWTGYRKVGLKKKGDKMVNDCRPVKKKK